MPFRKETKIGVYVTRRLKMKFLCPRNPGARGGTVG